jgi:large subunit ribosomal protein L11
MDFCKQFNAKTQDQAGKILPVIITYYTDKSYDFVVKTPPVAIQLMEVAKIKGGSAEPNRKKLHPLLGNKFVRLLRTKWLT